MELTRARLRELFDYDPETGVVTRLVRTANRHKVGEAVGTKGSRGYLQATVFGKKYPLHRLVWFWVHGVWPPYDVDHRNRMRTDNRIKNLRCATRAENNHNAGRSRANWSGYTGVAWDSARCKWLAQISVAGKSIHLGRFDSALRASAAYQAAKLIHHPTVENT